MDFYYDIKAIRTMKWCNQIDTGLYFDQNNFATKKFSVVA